MKMHDCDYLRWYNRGILYAFVGEYCTGGENCGFATLDLNTEAVIRVYWRIGASQSIFSVIGSQGEKIFYDCDNLW